MSDITPFFITGANAILRVNGQIIGMATDVNYKIDVKHAEPHVLGVYEAMEIQPMSYEVHGEFTMIKYHQKNIQHMLDRGYSIPHGLREDKNGLGTWTMDKLFAQLGMPVGKYSTEGRAHQSFDPSKFHKSMSFDIEIRVKIPAADSVPEMECTIAFIRNARLTSSSFRVGKRGVAIQAYSFAAQYLNEDTFVADMSGVGQQFM